MNKGYAVGVGMLDNYLATSRQFLSSEEIKQLKSAGRYQKSAQRALDLSELPIDLSEETSRRLALQLKEVLDRLDLPALDTIPDAEDMAKSEFKYWVIPNSEIRIQRVQTGPRVGEYLFTPQTLNRLPEFYESIKDLPYKPGANEGWYDFFNYSPAGVAVALHQIVPPRWLIESPHYRNRLLYLDQPAWRWFGIVVVLGIGLIFIRLCFRLRRYLKGRLPKFKPWINLLRPASVVIVAAISAMTLAQVLRISGLVYQIAIPLLWTIFYFSLTWLVWVLGEAIALSLIAREHLRFGSIDSQLILMVVRLISFITAVAILVFGADHLGLPAYSMLAGFGVGGLAVALAAQQTFANLLGSLIIMIEKPFKLGDSIKLKDTEGTVEKVGFRSTRIRTPYNSLVTIPSSELVNSTIDNLELRNYRQINTTLMLAYDTPVETIKPFIAAIEQLLENHENTRKDNIQVFFYEFAPASLNILVNFFIQVSKRADELQERQQILLSILCLAEELGVRFAVPTQSLHIKSLPNTPG
jgi:MscS family membrane protein